MKETVEYFEKNGYVVLSNSLTPQQCNQLVEHMFTLHKEGKLVQDDQCPMSDAVYGDPVFDNILQKFAKPIGDAVGRTLLPTYTYARIYRPGEILKKHKDRPSCEISATLTLGYDAKNVWPIFFDEEKQIPISLEVGELAVYKGCEVLHWRTSFKGNWHVQVFLHYVDANGPYKDHYRDGRPEFGADKTQNVSPNVVQQEKKQMPVRQKETQKQEPFELPRDFKAPKPVMNSVVIPNGDNLLPGYIACEPGHLESMMFSKEECDKIISYAKDLYPTNASVGGSTDKSKVDASIRSADIYVLENNDEHRWIYERIAKIVSTVNRIHFDYEIAGITHGIQLIHYRADADIPGHYDWHVDAGNGEVAVRKISFTAQLSHPNSYEGCELVINNHATEVIGRKDQGSIHLFPSYMPHIVTPITKGERYALVIWIHGSRRFR
jgi:predicted 2-oxoglutarate/Fe(II)-dependent dioxygenase YbiX